MSPNVLKLRYELDLAPNSTWLTVTASTQAKGTLLHVQELGIFYAHSEYYTERAGLNSYLIKYTLGGEGEFRYGAQQSRVREGSLFWVDCHQHQYYSTSPDSDSWDVIWVHFYGESAKQYYELFVNQNGGSNVLSMPPDNEIAQKMNQLIDLYHGATNDFMTDVEASGVLTSLLLEIIKSLAAADSYTQIPETIVQAKEYMKDHYQEHISLDDLSSELHINKFHFLRIFKRHVGMTPNEFLIQTRLNKAKGFLRTTDNTVTQIASLVGIPNTSHFINLFKKHEQTTPAAYRHAWYGTRS